MHEGLNYIPKRKQSGVIKRSVRHDRTSYNKEMLLKPKVIDGINCNRWKSMIHTFLYKVFVTGTFRYTDAVVYYTGCVTSEDLGGHFVLIHVVLSVLWNLLKRAL